MGMGNFSTSISLIIGVIVGAIALIIGLALLGTQQNAVDGIYNSTLNHCYNSSTGDRVRQYALDSAPQTALNVTIADACLAGTTANVAITTDTGVKLTTGAGGAMTGYTQQTALAIYSQFSSINRLVLSVMPIMLVITVAVGGALTGFTAGQQIGVNGLSGVIIAKVGLLIVLLVVLQLIPTILVHANNA